MARLRHVAFMSDQPDKLSDFYQTFFGVEEVGVYPNGSRVVIDGLFNLAFLKPSDPTQAQGINHYGFMVDNLEDAVARLPIGLQPIAATQSVLSKPAEARFVDPWGNNVDLSSKGFLGREEKKLPGVRLVVVQVPDPKQAAKFYHDQFDLYEVRQTPEGTHLLSDGILCLALTRRQAITKTGPQYVGIQVDNLSKVIKHFKEHRVEIACVGEELGPLRIKDPEGNQLLVTDKSWT